MAEKTKLEKLMEEMDKKYGKGTILTSSKIEEVDSVTSGSLTLDIATGINGIPIGKLIEIFGPESSGKSTLTLHIIAEFQKAGKKCVIIDTEHSFDKKYATNLGIKTEELLISQPNYMEDAYNIIESLIKSGEVGLIVFDSHSSSAPKKIADGEVGDATIGLQARTNSVALMKIHPLLNEYKCTMLAISQTRVNIGGYGDPNVTTGGNAYKFYSDMRFKIGKSVDKTEEHNITKVEVIKNKCAAPFGKAEFNIIWGEGIDILGEVIDLSVEQNLISKGGAWYTIGEQKLQGKESVKNYLRDNLEFTEELKNKLKNAYSNKKTV